MNLPQRIRHLARRPADRRSHRLFAPTPAGLPTSRRGRTTTTSRAASPLHLSKESHSSARNELRIAFRIRRSVCRAECRMHPSQKAMARLSHRQRRRRQTPRPMVVPLLERRWMRWATAVPSASARERPSVSRCAERRRRPRPLLRLRRRRRRARPGARCAWADHPSIRLRSHRSLHQPTVGKSAAKARISNGCRRGSSGMRIRDSTSDRPPAVQHEGQTGPVRSARCG